MMAVVVLDCALYGKRVDRATGREVAGPLVNRFDVSYEVEGASERDLRQAALRIGKADWPGHCLSVKEVRYGLPQ